MGKSGRFCQKNSVFALGQNRWFRCSGYCTDSYCLAACSMFAGSIRRINCRRGSTNCINCAVATDAMLAGRPASALLGDYARISILEQIFGAEFSETCDIASVSQALLAAGTGSRAIVFGARSEGIGHVFNAVNQTGVIRFLDGQTGAAAVLDEFVDFRFLRTG